ncbi:MAG TPA: alpha-glucosidase [Candidatus Choladousia intestinavium]|uniref:Alpha-glucosidase n=1 Tax=Candidatus Choladousia intestinavium TaxID=2840727 RepID=A0A9D1AC48_9FIRM|nr:alpha-glucosidase [Candidatus Choladousia intestinavium]
MKQAWWKSAVIYQIYPRSFCDSNGDGIGDLQGIISKLDYLKELGIDAIWLSPVYRSPQDDNGYDISDYQDIDPLFGTLEDMDQLIAEAKKRGIRIIMDLVLNHSSDEHPWFLEAKKSRDNPYHDYYVWRDGVEGIYPNDLKAGFGGPAWQWVPECGQYYLHQFSVKQPDLNWDNPKVREEIYKMIQWWVDRGIGGFRLDVIDKIAKEPDRMVMEEGTMLHPYLKEMSKAVFQQKELVTVGEAWSATPERALLYSNPDGSELSMVFQFEHILLDQQPGKEKWDLAPLPFVQFKEILAKWQKALYQKGWNSLFFENHDLPRSVSRFGNDGRYRVESAKMLATCLHGMQGTPYIYQGQEIGMTNTRMEIEEYRDIELLNMYKERIEKGYPREEVMKSIYAKGRDNARTPMQWDDTENAGFTKGTPWLKVNPNYREINAENAKKDPDSIFRYYQKLIQLRKSLPVLTEGAFDLLLPQDPSIFAYTRTDGTDQLLILCNFTDQELPCSLKEQWKDKEALISNYAQDSRKDCLRPYEAVILARKL